MWNFTDDMGVHRDDNYSLKAEVFPLDDLTIKDIDNYKQELIKSGLVKAFEDVLDGKLLFIKNWYKYQYIKKPTPSKYSLPDEILQFFTDSEIGKYHLRTLDNEYGTSTEPVPPKRKEKNRIEENEIESNLKEEKSEEKEDKNDCFNNNPFIKLQQELPSAKS